MRLFVDCDDTLVLYQPESDGPHPYGLMYDDALYVWNTPLIEFIKCWQEDNPDDLLVVWSGGGSQYAQRVGEQAGLRDFTALTKDMTTFPLVGEDDIVVDDQELKVAAKVRHPSEFKEA